ncbi:MAG: HflK protein [Alphaproteobacteria bacterium RIFCSPHIGHO2_12_FULL_45_9]|nr:MAG: HflK protein [Alphaproteobacteria bacterium RIFCSPHIGHO2_02_FULL_46_13]OFW95761.1 MAG: HflK protein [Alphaproteobacteria bacterium RIFCSPHIGHO2_12_FULL_45_9]
MTWNNDNDGRPNPWGKPQGNQDKDNNRQNRPSGNSPDNNDIDFDALFRKAKTIFDNNVPGGNGGNANSGRYLTIGIIAAIILWLLSGLYFVQPNQNGVVLTFGKYTRTDEVPGPKWKMPWPIQSVNVVDVTTERRIQIGYNTDDTGYSTASKNTHTESLMLTGDENIVDINFVVLWRVGNAKDFLYSVRDPEDTIAMVAASTMREIIGQTNIQPALTDARTKIQSDARILMQKLLDEYHTGVTINNVQLQKVDPPDAVVDAFNDVQRARQKKEELRNLAEAYRNDIIPRAKGEAEKMRQAASAYKQQIVSQATGDASRFNSILAAYKNAPTVTSERMYLEAMEGILQNTKTVILGNKDSNVLPYLPLNELKKDAK